MFHCSNFSVFTGVKKAFSKNTGFQNFAGNSLFIGQSLRNHCFSCKIRWYLPATYFEYFQWNVSRWIFLNFPPPGGRLPCRRSPGHGFLLVGQVGRPESGVYQPARGVRPVPAAARRVRAGAQYFRTEHRGRLYAARLHQRPGRVASSLNETSPSYLPSTWLVPFLYIYQSWSLTWRNGFFLMRYVKFVEKRCVMFLR